MRTHFVFNSWSYRTFCGLTVRAAYDDTPLTSDIGTVTCKTCLNAAIAESLRGIASLEEELALEKDALVEARAAHARITKQRRSL